MRKALLCLLLACSSAIAAPTLEDVATSSNTFAVCKAVDIASTAYLLKIGGFTEANPIVAWSLRIGGYGPLIALSGGIYWLLKHQESKAVAVGANVVTCGVAAHNLLLIP